METSAHAPKAKGRQPSWVFWLAIATILGFLLTHIPRYVHSGPGKLTGIINNLRQIDGAKQQFAFERGITNAAQITVPITEQDLALYLPRTSQSEEFMNPKYGERYMINRLDEPPEAYLTQPIKEYDAPAAPTYPQGTIVRLDQIIRPGQTMGNTNSPSKSIVQ